MKGLLRGSLGFLNRLTIGLMGLLYMGPMAMASGLVFPASGVKAPYSPLAIPTYFKPIDVSLDVLLNQHYTIVSAHEAGGEEILILTRKEESMGARSNAACALTMPNVETDQTVVTSRCWALNRPGKEK